MREEKLLTLLVITTLFLSLAGIVQAQSKTYVWDRLDADITLWVRSFFSDKSRLSKLSGIDLHKVQK